MTSFELTRMIDAGTVPANNGNRLYIVYVPPGATIATDWVWVIARFLPKRRFPRLKMIA